MKDYNPKKIEEKWQRVWERKKLFRADEKSKKPKFYPLVEFPYPSGEGLHVGHPRSYGAMDIVARKRRMEGFNVMYPIGFDAFGLPTENFAIKTGRPPKEVTKENVATFTRQLKSLGISFDWSREVNTTDPNYYKWTQWIFQQFLKRGLAYKKKMPVNWCPSCKIVLANEEVVGSTGSTGSLQAISGQAGKCERCGTPVEKREKEQWMLAITKYADRLDKDLDLVDYLPQIKLQQRNWIGRSEGAVLSFKLKVESPEKKRVLVGTRNKAKFSMLKACLKDVPGIELISLNDIPKIDDSDLIEGDDVKENARKKSEYYFKKTGIPTISTDHVFWIEKWPDNGGVITHIRELANPKTKKGTDKEVIAFLQNFLKSVGGKSRAHFIYAISYTDANGTYTDDTVPFDYQLQMARYKDFWDGYPIEALLVDEKTGQYKTQQPDEVRYGKVAELLKTKFVPYFGLQTGSVDVFTTRPDTLFGATYLVLAPENPIIENWKLKIENWSEVERYIKATKNKTEIERVAEDRDPSTGSVRAKTGVKLDGVTAINPANGEKIPVWIADYVLAEYGTGAIMAVPAHDERDFQFAKKYSLPIKFVVCDEPTNLALKELGELSKSKDLPVVIGGGFALDIHSDQITRNHCDLDLYIEEDRVKDLVEYYRKRNFKILSWDVDNTPDITWIGGFYAQKEQNGKAVFEVEIHPLKSRDGLVSIDFGTVKQKLGRVEDVFATKRFGTNTFRVFSITALSTIKKAMSSPYKEERDKDKVDFNRMMRIGNGDAYMGDAVVFVGNGFDINSGKFDGMDSEEAKWKITEAVGGRKVTKFKLRDWIFSRQHYWGEPIPVVFCNECRNRKHDVVLIHGFASSSKKGWRPWLKRELEARGHTVFALDLPNPDHPNVKEQADFVLKNVKLDKNTILIGGSLGGTVLMRVLEKSETKIYKGIFVDSVLRPKFTDKDRPEVVASDDWKINFTKVKKMAKEFVVLADENFSTIPKEHSEELAKIFEARLVYANPEKPHFKGDKEPEILKIFDDEGIVPVPENKLPVKLPDVKNYQPTDTGESPLASISKWVNTKCPRCGGNARRETDTMPNWAGSSWYYLRYVDPRNTKEFASMKKLEYWLGPACPVRNPQTEEKESTTGAEGGSPNSGSIGTGDRWISNGVDWYNGGMEHTTLHLLYSRFWHKFLFDCGYVPTPEPYKKRTSHGLILAENGEKMSKSRGNVVNPDEMVERFGADTLRTYEMFMGPFDQAIAWSTDGMVGVRRFLEKVWRIGSKLKVESLKFEDENLQLKTYNLKLESLIHKTVKKVGEDIEAMRFNTAVSALMIAANEMDASHSVPKPLFEMFLKILSPFAPHISEELWSILGHKTLIAAENWPAFDAAKIAVEEVTIVVQVNGKVRGQFSAASGITEQEALETAKNIPGIANWLKDKEVKKAFYVKGRLVNFVV